MQAVIRTYSGTGAKELFDLLETQKSDVDQKMRSIDGFVSYLLLRTDDGGATVTVCRDKAGIEQSIETARQWVSANASHIQAPPPRVIRGPVIAQVAAEAHEATAAVPLPTVS
jgi:hypothetical protein